MADHLVAAEVLHEARVLGERVDDAAEEHGLQDLGGADRGRGEKEHEHEPPLGVAEPENPEEDLDGFHSESVMHAAEDSRNLARTWENPAAERP